MIKKLAMLLSLLFLAAGGTLALAGPAAASVPDWDLGTVHSAAEWNSIKTVLDTPADWTYFHNQPASPAARLKKDAGDCPTNMVAPYNEILCLWNGYSYQGTIWKLPISWLYNGSGAQGNGLSFTGSGINNASKGWWNRSWQAVSLYDNAVCQDSGFIRDLTAGQFAVSDSASSNDWENRFSSASEKILRGYACTNDPND